MSNPIQSAEPEHEPAETDVAKWLEENDRKRGVPKAGEDPVPIKLTDRARALLEAEAEHHAETETVRDTPPPESPENPLYRDDLPTQQKAMAFAMDHKSMGKIVATERERSLYWKAILNEVPIIMELEIMNQVPVVLQSLSAFDLDVVLECANADIKEKKIPDGLPAFTGRAQTYAAMMQTRKFNGIDQPDLCFTRPYPPLDEAVKKIRQAYDDRKYLHDHPRWNAMIAAVRLFEAKCKICNDNLLNRNFWLPANSA